MTKDIDLSGIIKTYDLIEEQNHYALIQEDIQGISLADYKNSSDFRLNRIL